MNDLTRFQDLQVKLVEGGFDTTLNARREQNEAVFSLTVALHHQQTPELMAKLTQLVSGYGFSFTAENETIAITAVDTEVRDARTGLGTPTGARTSHEMNMRPDTGGFGAAW